MCVLEANDSKEHGGGARKRQAYERRTGCFV